MNAQTKNQYPLEIVTKTKGFFNQCGGKKCCFLLPGQRLRARRNDTGQGFIAYVEMNGWNEKAFYAVEMPSEHVSQWQQAQD